MVTFLLIIIACALLFGKEKTKEGIGLLMVTILILVLLGMFISVFD